MQLYLQQQLYLQPLLLTLIAGCASAPMASSPASAPTASSPASAPTATAPATEGSASGNGSARDGAEHGPAESRLNALRSSGLKDQELTPSSTATPRAAADRALKQLEREIRPLVAQGAAAPIAGVLSKHALQPGTRVRAERDERGEFTLPLAPPAGIEADEWQAFHSNDHNLGAYLDEGEPRLSYLEFIDLDDDGQRDLIARVYRGGTGLFSGFYVYRREGDSFAAIRQPSDFEAYGDELYAIAGRGADDEGYWVRLDDGIFLALRSGEYGEDKLILLEPFSDAAWRWDDALTVESRYEYRLLGPPPVQAGGASSAPPELDETTRAALERALVKVGRDADGKETDRGRCPGYEADDSNWPWFEPEHYTIQLIADFAARRSGDCLAVRLSCFRSVSRARLPLLSMRLHFRDSPDGPIRELEVAARRYAVGMHSSDEHAR